MKSSTLTTYLACFVFLLFSCSNDNEIIKDQVQGKATLAFAAVLNDLISTREAGKQQLGNIPQCSKNAPVYVEVVLSHTGIPIAGTFQQPLRLRVMQDSRGIYFTEENLQLELDPNIYSLDYFRVLDENLQVIWIAPRVEAGEVNFAGLVDFPLPLEIDLRAGTKRYVDVNVICYDNRLINFYGYLFLELMVNQAIKFCVFGNYCDETGRHADAVSYNVSVWSYSGNETAPKGAVIHEGHENAIFVEDDFENEISVTYAVPLCLALPDTPGQDQFYFEITLLEGMGIDAPNPLIRRGVITEDDVRSLFEGDNNLDYYHFREGNCNLEDSPNLFNRVTGEPSVEEVFLPTLQSYYAPRGGVEWIHEYNEEGGLRKSLMYERFPYRLNSEFNYSNYSEEGLPLQINRVNYQGGEILNSTSELTYSNNKINMIASYDATGNFISKSFLMDYDDANRATGIHYYNENDSFIERHILQYDSMGRVEVSTIYSSETGTSEGEIIRREENAYTPFGEIHISEQIINGVERMLEYFYREDNTLKAIRSIIYEEEPILQVVEFDENEAKNFESVTQGVYRTDYTSFFDDGSPHIVHSYHGYFLYRIITYNEDGSSEWKIIDEDDFSYRIEYKDPSDNIYKTEFYNSDGELISEE